MGPSGSEGARRSGPPTTERPEAVRVRLLGGFRVSVGSRTIEQNQWRLRKAAALVKVLALAPAHHLQREQAIDLLWPDLGKKAASNNLRQALHAARRALDPERGSLYLASRDESLVLCPRGNLWVDIEAFEEAAVGTRRARDRAVYRAAIDLYAGDLLPEDRYEEWGEARREELRRLHLGLLVELAGLYEERGQYGLAIEALRKAVAEEPTFEEAHSGLMRLYALSHQSRAALTQYGRLREIVSRELGTEPSETTQRLREDIAAGTFSPDQLQGGAAEESFGIGRHNLPAARTSFVGREQEIVEIKRELAMTRLLTLTGAGGSGKTRLAIEVARKLVGAYPEGVWLVELAGLSEGTLVTQTVAATLGVQEQPDRPLINTLVDFLREKKVLLILDNCEHLLEAATRFTDTLLDSCPRLTVLATSREALGVGGEILWQVRPLSLPATTYGGSIRERNGKYSVEGLMRYEAVRLFVDRAHLRLPSFQLTQENAGAVARVCRRLDGIPLAIELATARMGALAVEQVAQRLEGSLDVLRSAGRTAAPRQQTLRATMDWSHDLLSEAERRLFRRLSVFAGGWTLEAAEAVCSGEGIDKNDGVNLLGGLVDKSLVVVESSMSGAVRYRMLEPIRQYALEKLEKSAEAERVRERHIGHYLALAEAANPELMGPDQASWLEQLEIEHANLRATLTWALDPKGAQPEERAESGLRLAAALGRFWNAHGPREGLRWLERGLARSGASPKSVRAKALGQAGYLAIWQGNYEEAVAMLEESLVSFKELKDKPSVATLLASLGTAAVHRSDHRRVPALRQEAEALRPKLSDLRATAELLIFLGMAAMDEGDRDRAIAHFEESLTLCRELGDGRASPWPSPPWG
jgi:predicted ATPase/DNA-binding SARP family transcriptional activator